MYVKTNTFLDKILAQKTLDLRRIWGEAGGNLDGGPAWHAQVRHYAEQATPPRGFIGALRKDTVALIAEVKKASPSKGVLIEDFDPVRIGKTYADNGAAAISVLTDEPFFQGHLDYMRAVRAATTVPVLRKDFIIDDYQVYEGRASGADAMLLIAATLDDAQLADLHATITGLGMAALVEVHEEAEMERALKLGARLIGINNRDLRTFDVDLATTARRAPLVPEEVVLVAESGIRDADDVRRMGELGAHAVLVGESLVRAHGPDDGMAQAVRAFSSQPRLAAQE
jgi:indole-3-glycerol phosphate synthase